MFGEWAILVDNNKESVIAAFKALSLKEFNLTSYRDRWNMEVNEEISAISSFLSKNKE